MKKLVVMLAFLFVVLTVTQAVDARWRLRRYYTNYATAIDYGEASTDQEMCEVEAAYQAANYAYYHVGVNIGRFEGWGCGSVANCSTCIPGGMTLTGDASCQATNGQWFRVRSWR